MSGSLYGALLGSLIAFAVADFLGNSCAYSIYSSIERSLFILLNWLTLGRKLELITAAFLYVLGGSITAYAPELGVLLVGRLLYGLGIGLVGYFDL